jgi:hypothetical protein
MIDVGIEKLMTFGEAGRLLGWQPSPATFWRWRVKGVNNVRLDCVRVGGRWMTSREAIQRFVEQSSSNPIPVAAANVGDLEAELVREGLL